MTDKERRYADKERRYLAFHEAGHMVMMFWLGESLHDTRITMGREGRDRLKGLPTCAPDDSTRQKGIC
jgi:hypothetical protein